MGLPEIKSATRVKLAPGEKLLISAEAPVNENYDELKDFANRLADFLGVEDESIMILSGVTGMQVWPKDGDS